MYTCIKRTVTTSCLTLLLYRLCNQQRAVCRDFSFTLKPTGSFDGSQGGPNTLHMSLATPRFCDLKKMLSRPRHLSLHLKPRLLSKPLRHRRCARCLPILCVCVSVHIRDVSWVLWRYVLSLLSGCGRVSLRVLNFCSPLPRHLYAFDRCPWCWTTVWVKAGVIEWGTCTHTGGSEGPT